MSTEPAALRASETETYYPCVYHDHGNVRPSPVLGWDVAVSAPLDWDALYATVRAMTRTENVTFVRTMPDEHPAVLRPGEFVRRLAEWAAAGAPLTYGCCSVAST